MPLPTHCELTRFLASQTSIGGEKERLRQEKILSTTKESAQLLEQQELSELKALKQKKDLSPEKEMLLGYLKTLYPEEAETSH
jgi:hypothetical protein